MMMMKNLNGSSRDGGSNVNYKEGMKLLDIESSDSDTQSFALPPLDLKGARKKKSKIKSTPSSGGGRDDGCCSSCRSCCVLLSVVLFIVALLSMAVIGYFTYQLHNEVKELKAKVASDRADWKASKLDPQTKVNVDFKPSKKMKKRRELDALVNGKSGRRKKKGQHELLRNDTDSSDGDDYSLGDKNGVRKRGGALRFCPTCVAVTAFFLLTACIVTVGGLVWVHIDLKREVDHLRTQLNKVESWSQTNPDEFHDLHSNVKDINAGIQEIKATVSNHHINISDIYRRIGVLNTTTQGLTKSLAAAPLLETLPEDVKKVSEQLVAMGSEVTTMKANTQALVGLQAFKDDTSTQLTALSTRLEKLEAKPVDDGTAASSTDVNSLQRETQTLRQLINNLNLTFTNKFYMANTYRENNMVRIEALRNSTETLLRRVDDFDTRLATATDLAAIHDAITTEISKLNISSSGNVDSSLLQDLQSRTTVLSNRLTSLESELKMMATHQGLTNLTSRVDALSTNMDQHVEDLTVQEGRTTQKITDLQNKVAEHDTRLQKLEQPVQQTGSPASSPENGPVSTKSGPINDSPGGMASQPTLRPPPQEGGSAVKTALPPSQQTGSTDLPAPSATPTPGSAKDSEDDSSEAEGLIPKANIRSEGQGAYEKDYAGTEEEVESQLPSEPLSEVPSGFAGDETRIPEGSESGLTESTKTDPKEEDDPSQTQQLKNRNGGYQWAYSSTGSDPTERTKTQNDPKEEDDPSQTQQSKDRNAGYQWAYSSTDSDPTEEENAWKAARSGPLSSQSTTYGGSYRPQERQPMQREPQSSWSVGNGYQPSGLGSLGDLGRKPMDEDLQRDRYGARSQSDQTQAVGSEEASHTERRGYFRRRSQIVPNQQSRPVSSSQRAQPVTNDERDQWSETAAGPQDRTQYGRGGPSDWFARILKDVALPSPAPLPTNPPVSPDGQDSAGDGVTGSEGARRESETPLREPTEDAGGSQRDRTVPERRAARGNRRSSGEEDDKVNSFLSALEKSTQ